MTKDETAPKKTKAATLTPVTESLRWPEGHSPQDVMDSIGEDLPNISDLIIVAHFLPDERGVDKYAISTSEQSLVSKLGMIELAKILLSSQHEET